MTWVSLENLHYKKKSRRNHKVAFLSCLNASIKICKPFPLCIQLPLVGQWAATEQIASINQTTNCWLVRNNKKMNAPVHTSPCERSLALSPDICFIIPGGPHTWKSKQYWERRGSKWVTNSFQFSRQLYGKAKKKSLQLIWMGTFSVMQEHIFSRNGLMKEQGDTDCELKFIELN